MIARWVAVTVLSDLAPGSKKLVAADVGAEGATHPTRLLVVHHIDGTVHVVDGRCPHEGYPLSDAAVDAGCVLTCAWHNWKFDLRTGDSTLGGEGVRRWPSRVVAGQVEVDLAGPDPKDERSGRFVSLTTALEQGGMGRGLRDSLRLLVAGVPAAEVCAHLARHDALHAQWGTTHTLPVAADCARLAGSIADPFEALHRLAPALDIAVAGARRTSRRPGAEESDVARAASELGEDGARLLAEAVEAEDALQAEAIVRAGHRCGVDPAVIEGWLLHSIARHFTDFGHSLIYLQKLRELRLNLGEVATPDLLADLCAGLAVSLAYGTREDTLPYMRAWFARDLPEGVEASLLEALVDGRRSVVLPALSGALASRPLGSVANDLIAAGAHRLEWFDEAIGEDPDIDEDWLSATHRFTASLAIAELIEHLPCSTADAHALLRQGAAFVSLGRATDRAEAPPRRDVDESWQEPLMDAVLDDRFTRAIRLAHGVKVLVAASDARARLPEHLADAPVHAVRRYFDVPAKQRRLRSQVQNSIRWLRDGKPPRRLTQ